MSIDDRYGWFLRHRITGRFVRIDNILSRLASVVDDIRDADRFETREQAQSVYDFLSGLSFPPCVVVDATIPQNAIPDADTAKVPTLDDVLDDVRRRAAEAYQVPLLSHPAHENRYGVGAFGPPLTGAASGPLFPRRFVK